MNANIRSLPFSEVKFAETSVEDSVVRLVRYAANLPASDLFISFEETDVAISVRCLGTVRLVARITHEQGRRIINHVKAVSGMDLAQQRRPLDGRWVCSLDGKGKLDLRVNTIPTMYGEDLCARLLKRGIELLEMDHLGLHQKGYVHLKAMLGSPSGLILVTGPTGVGKTTTLYACLNYLNDGDRKINTIEDPVEYALPGIHQSEVKPAYDLDFPELLRSVLRQSPDVIMIGEIRDATTAETAVRAANSGHLVFATIHAPIAAAGIDSMLALGVHPHFLSTSLLGILTQRLVRTLCPKCRVEWDITAAPHTFDEVRAWLEPGKGEHICSAPGCEECFHEGFTGRVGVFEVLSVTREIRKLVADRAPPRLIEEKALEQGMLSMRQAALLKVADGSTSIEEVVRTIPTEHLMADM
jgi:type II secretory ATPase GspE/PulE/Tfp pilus assembly ATPase PilB-like protein